jgi:NADPH-dependent glutamate synthase beta subunit-like oxidoreductase/NAD(P)H-flavin reductase
MNLQIPGWTFDDLYNPGRIALLTDLFYEEVRKQDAPLADRFLAFKEAQGQGYADTDVSSILVAMGPHLSRFVAGMFGVENECRAMRVRADREQIIFVFKKEFFQRRVLKKYTREQAAESDPVLLELQARAIKTAFPHVSHEDLELETAACVAELLEHEKFVKEKLPEASERYAAAMRLKLQEAAPLRQIVPAGDSEPALRSFLSSLVGVFEKWTARQYYHPTPETRDWVTFRVPRKVDYQHLVEAKTLQDPLPDFNIGHEDRYRRREGFDLTDPRYTNREVMSEVDYCIFCHARDKDSCRKGIPEAGGYRKNPLGFSLKGCPLDQRISESHVLKNRGDSLGALALIMIDNPLLPGTGHRICNDCMKACIYQKQDPVNIPQIETRILMDVLELPWGFEIYSLLTRWNPLNIRRPHALPYNGVNILVVGLGPAGYTLAHYFLNEGFGVVGIDGLKIEPLPAELVGDDKTPFKPLKDFSSVYRKLSDRVLMGFGGVSEYGITVRWDKNFLTVIALTLLRRAQFRVFDGVRFGGTITVEDAWTYGFDHVCFATGAGKPTFVSMKQNLIRGIRKASDFLMALQLTGAGKVDSMANLQMQLPAVVIGGGLTAIDTATELMAYYPVQVTKIKKRYDLLVLQYGRDAVEKMFDREELPILATFLRHAGAVDAERERAAAAGEAPDLIPLIRSWGGVHIYYRKSMLDSPAYRLNHEEIIKGLEEGISFVERMSPREAVADEFGAVKEMVFERQEAVGGKWKGKGQSFVVPAKTVMVAAGTVPNVMYERERPGTFALDDRDEFFETFAWEGGGDNSLAKPDKDQIGFFTSYEKDGRYVTFYGDNHPDYAGNVVKAMASAKHGFQSALPHLERRIARVRGASGGVASSAWPDFIGVLERDLRPHVVVVNRLTPTITEIVVHAPKAAREFRPGQFYRLQNYEVDSPRIENTLVMMEGIALTGAWVDREKGNIGLITLEVGASSRMCALLKPGQRVVVMGPTGTPTEITEDGTALLLGGGLGNAVLFSIAKAFKERNNRVIYFAGYRKREDFFKREEIEGSTDVVVYSVDAGEPIPAIRPQDKSFVGNIVQAMLAYGRGELGDVPVPLSDALRIIAIGSDRMMAAVTKARHDVLKPYLNEEHVGIASINSPMQCMLKAVCAQCLQRHVDPKTGKEEFVFTCFNQDQHMDEVDFTNLNARLKTNSLMEKITNRWFDYILEKHPLAKV